MPKDPSYCVSHATGEKSTLTWAESELLATDENTEVTLQCSCALLG